MSFQILTFRGSGGFRVLCLLAAIAAAAAADRAQAKSEDSEFRGSITLPASIRVSNKNQLSDSQKRTLRAQGADRCREWVRQRGGGSIRSISILSDGRVRCHYTL